MIPPDKYEAVTRGLREAFGVRKFEAFGVTEFEDIRRLVGGHSPGILVFRIVIQARAYLLRIITRTDDPTRHFTSMKTAAEAGIAPRVWYTSTEDRLSITDFIEAVPFPTTEALVRMPVVLRALHSLRPFDRVPDHLNTSCMFLINKGPALAGFLEKFQAANPLSKDESQELFALYAQVAAVYPRNDADMVSSHNDLFKPDNILFDGHRVWLVDWEAAFLNDRYADLAVVANQLVTNDSEERAYLNAYFGQLPDQSQRARYFLMQQIAHIFYTMAFLFAGLRDKSPEQGENAPELADFQRRFWTGEIRLEDKRTKTLYSRFHLQQLRQNTSQRRFREALKIVSDYRP